MSNRTARLRCVWVAAANNPKDGYSMMGNTMELFRQGGTEFPNAVANFSPLLPLEGSARMFSGRATTILPLP